MRLYCNGKNSHADEREFSRDKNELSWYKIKSSSDKKKFYSQIKKFIS